MYHMDAISQGSLQYVRAHLDCLAKPSDIMHLTKSDLSKLQDKDFFTK